jgi:hypothetical protein
MTELRVIKEVNLSLSDPEGFKKAIELINNIHERGYKVSVVAKFTCNSIKKSRNYNGPEFVYDYQFNAVTSGSEENKQFFGSTPSGEIILRSVRNNLYEPGKSYYVTFTEASE